MNVLIVGAGLIGTSAGLALTKAGHHVALSDANAAHIATAAELGAGSAEAPGFVPEVVLVATPPAAIAPVIRKLSQQYVNATFTDVGSIKTQPQQDIEAFDDISSRYVGGHPMAGRETSGPSGARADLFVDRLWILTPTSDTDPTRIEMVRRLAEDCGAVVRIMPAEDHDRAVALTSHTPQILASIMAGLIAQAPATDIQISGQGLRDLTRIAGSNPELWSEILAANAAEIEAVLAAFEERLSSVRNALRTGASLHEMLHVGNAGRNRIPAKHGGEPKVPDAVIGVAIDDRPGALAELFATAADAQISIEDVRIDHMLGRELAIVELSVNPASVETLRAALLAGGWELRS